jgi:hypothetical protein
MDLARQHYIRPLLLRSLKSVCWDAVPRPIKRGLERFKRDHVQKNLLFAGELVRLCGLFQQNDIPVATFKGPVLAMSLYGDLALREFADLDLLIHDTDLDKAENILAGSGYQADFPDKDYRSAFISYQGEYTFRHSKTGILIDLHWQLASKGIAYPIQPAELWSKLEQVTIASRTVATLGREDLALFLAAHGTREGWRSVGWVCDFAEFLRSNPDIDWAAILARAKQSQTSRPLLLAILLASTLLEAPAPVELLRQAQSNSAVQSLAKEAQLRMLRTAPEGELEELLGGRFASRARRHS